VLFEKLESFDITRTQVNVLQTQMNKVYNVVSDVNQYDKQILTLTYKILDLETKNKKQEFTFIRI
jgi:Asp-tRNA(Asn)/Glu-tRNA(Gln) amidotransferase C subunit